MSRLLTVAWTRQTLRASELAGALGGEALQVSGGGLRGRWSAPVRWAVNAAATTVTLVRRRPRVVIVQNPPIFAPLIVWAYAALTRSVFVLDSHPVAFGRKDGGLWRLLLPVHRFLARRAALVLVTTEELGAEVRAWGGRAAVVHEAPPADDADWRETADAGGANGTMVLFVGVFAPDEPVEAVVEAARRMPHATYVVTGAVDRAPAGLIGRAPGNVRFVGYLDAGAYRAAIAAADVILCLTTESTSVMRSACEAVYAEKPLVVSDHPISAELFPYAVPVANTADGIVAGVGDALARLPELRAAAPAALAAQQGRWAAQIAAVRAVAAASGADGASAR